MKNLLPLLALAGTACGPTLLDRGLEDIPGLVFVVPFNAQGANVEVTTLHFDWESGAPCYRIPEDTRLTVNGEAFTLENRGGVSTDINGTFSCELPSFKGAPRPVDEARTEYVLSDGKSNLRAVFQKLHGPRSFRLKVDDKEQTTLRNGSVIDIEWMPVTDRLEGAIVSFRTVGDDTSGGYVVESPVVDANHIRFILRSPLTGNLLLRVVGGGSSGVEACEGFSACTAELTQALELPVTIE